MKLACPEAATDSRPLALQSCHPRPVEFGPVSISKVADQQKIALGWRQISGLVTVHICAGQIKTPCGVPIQVRCR